MKKSPLYILGTGTFAHEVADYLHWLPQWELAGFIEGMDRRKCDALFLGRPVIWIEDVHTLQAGCFAVCAVGSTKRESFIARVAAHGLTFTTLVHPSAQIFPSATLGEGTLVGAGAVVGAKSAIGAHCVVNRGCLIGHHVRIGDYTTLGPGCNIAAGAQVGHGTFMGMGAAVIDRVTIGSGCTIVAGALVARDLPERVKAAGAPARVLGREVDRL